jgi:hypothetical protein
MKTLLPTLYTLLLLPGCIEPFSGSHIQFVMGRDVTTPCDAISKYALSVPIKCTTDEKQNRFLYHYELWATLRRSAAVYLTSFTVQRHLHLDKTYKYEIFKLEKDRVTLSSDRSFKIGLEQTFNELTKEEQKEHLARMDLASPVLSVTSFSTKMFAKDNKLHKDFFLGNHFQLTQPHNGAYFGQILSSHPFGPTTIGGGDLRVKENLTGLDSLWITIESGDPNRPNPKPSKTTYLSGTAVKVSRGTINVDAVSPYDSKVTATIGVFPALGEEEYF